MHLYIMHKKRRLVTIVQAVEQKVFFSMTQLYILNRNFTVIQPPPINTVRKVRRVKVVASPLWTILMLLVFVWILGNAPAADGFPVKNLPPLIRPRVLMMNFDDSGIEL